MTFDISDPFSQVIIQTEIIDKADSKHGVIQCLICHCEEFDLDPSIDKLVCQNPHCNHVMTNVNPSRVRRID